MKLVVRKEECSGCTACMNICPVQAIKMEADEKGFLYPSINKDLCINCGKCLKVCPYRNKVVNEEFKQEVYACKHKDDEIRANSSSGGLFTALSDVVLQDNGVIYGVRFDEDMNVIHARATTKEERDLFRGSKYVQSNLSDIFKQVHDDLKSKRVMFVGTPCQVAGLKNYIGQVNANLILVDLVCRGVTSPKLFKDHMKILNKKGQVKDYKFRYKKEGWRASYHRIDYENRSDSQTSLSQSYKTIYSCNLSLREACFNCLYASTKRISDITISDFWGIEKTLPAMDDNKGTSLAIINTLKGKELWKASQPSLVIKKSNFKDAYQPCLGGPLKQSPGYNKFWTSYQQKGYKYILKKYTTYGLYRRFRKIIGKILRKIKLIN